MNPATAPAAPIRGFPDLLRAIRRRSALVLATMVLSACAAAAWALRAPKQYRATATLLVERPLPTDLGIASPFATAQEVGRFAATQLQVLKSRAVLDVLEAALDLATWPEFAALPAAARGQALADAIVVEPRGDSALVDVSFVGLDPARAAQLVNRLCDAYLAHVATREKENVRNDLAVLNAELPRLAQQRDAARAELDDWKSRNATLTFDGRDELLQEELKLQSRSVQELTQAQDVLEARCAVIDTTAERDLSALARALDLEPSRALVEKQVEFETRRAELAGTPGTRTAQLQALDAEIARVAGELADERRRAIDALLLKRGIARTATAHAEARLAQLRATATELDRAKSAHATLSVRVTEATSILERLTLRRDELMVLAARAGNASRIFVQDPATAPTQPCAPHAAAAIAIALVLGLLVGGAAAVAIERFDDRVGAIEELETSLETSSIARIPHLPTREGRAPEHQWMVRPETFPADDFCKLFLTLGGDQGTPGRARTIAVLSAVPREGKTLVATGVALAAARAGFSTLLVDGDLKRPRLQDVFSLDGEQGALDLLAGRCALADVVHRTAFERLSLLPAGTPTPDLERLAQPKALAKFVESLRGGFQVVVFDTSPTLLSADAFVFARSVDTRVLVASAASSKVGPLRQAMSQLRHLGIEVAGTVINHFAAPHEPYGPYEAKPTGAAGSARRRAPRTPAGSAMEA
ncbi:MAG: polysaccharide biosynthesis tyrosine autokinase [Planctomycetes bacterium]|nr:polysaccharide biosynthesis tyrosine autokinase [Planctomycetota bacterium]